MKLTKLQRHTAYILMEKHLMALGNRDKRGRFCYIIFNLFGITNKGFYEMWRGKDWHSSSDVGDSINYVLNHFPELLNKQPIYDWPKCDAYGKKQRLDWLRQCIKETS